MRANAPGRRPSPPWRRTLRRRVMRVQRAVVSAAALRAGGARPPAARTVGAARLRRVDVEADAGVAALAVDAAAAGDVEGDGHDVALLDVLDVAANLDDLCGGEPKLPQRSRGACACETENGACARASPVISWPRVM